MGISAGSLQPGSKQKKTRSAWAFGEVHDEFDELVQGPCLIPDTAKRGMQLGQVLSVWKFAERHFAANVNMMKGALNLYELNSGLIKPSTAKYKCSLVELMARDAIQQIPEWFVSHWWGEPVLNFNACLQTFAMKRARKEGPELASVVFWICAYCNNQHTISDDVGDMNPAATSFSRALENTKGVVLVLDGAATPFTRVWCAFEIARTIEAKKTLDLVTYVPPTLVRAGSVALISDGFIDDDKDSREIQVGSIVKNATCEEMKALREATFPMDVADKGLDVCIQNATASVATDRVHILNALVGASDLEAPPPPNHPAYESVNAQLRSRFAEALLVQAITRGSSTTLEKICDAISRQPGKETLNLEVSNLNRMTNAVLVQLARSLSQDLTHLILGCAATCVGDHGFEALANKLESLTLLTRLTLRFGDTLTTTKSVIAFAAKLPCFRALTHLALSFRNNLNIGDSGLQAIAEGLPSCTSLVSVSLNFFGCSDLGDASLQGFYEALPRLICLKELRMYWGCTWVGNAGLQAIVDGLKNNSSLSCLELALKNTHVTRLGLEAVVAGTKHMKNLSSFALDLTNTPVARKVYVVDLPGLRSLQRSAYFKCLIQ